MCMHSPRHSKAGPLHWVVVVVQPLLQGTHKENGQLTLRSPDSPEESRGRGFKGGVREGLQGGHQLRHGSRTSWL